MNVCASKQTIFIAVLLLVSYTTIILIIVSEYGYTQLSKYKRISEQLQSISIYVPNSHRSRGLDYFDVDGFLFDLEVYLQKNGRLSDKVKPHQAPAKLNLSTNLKDIDSLIVCPDVYKGNRYGHPLYHTGFVTPECEGAKPLEELVTIFINYIHSTNYSQVHLGRVLKGIRSNYTKVPILVVVPDNVGKDILSTIDKFQANFTKFDESLHEGTILNKLGNGLIETPHVLIARDLNHFSWFSPLDRSLRVLTGIEDVSVVSGAFRNETAQWKVGCYQTEAKYYGLKYIEGYHRSKNECMLCDHVSGSFVTSLDILKNRKFDESLSREFLYADWFMELRLDGKIILACPDVMYFQSSSDVLEHSPSKQNWNLFAQKWQFDLIQMPSGRLEYTCEEVGIDCSDFGHDAIRQFARPPCCLKLVGIGMQEWHKFCVQHNIPSELDTGFALGGVKTNGMSPWDSDGDMTYRIQNHTYIYDRRNEIDSKKVKLGSWTKPEMDSSGIYTKDAYFSMKAGGVNIEMFSETALTYDTFLPEELKNNMTSLLFHGSWAYAPANPGMYSRNRYGHNFLKHAQSYWITKKASSFDPYEITHFEKCRNPRHHACLDKFHTDGNIQFQRG